MDINIITLVVTALSMLVAITAGIHTTSILNPKVRLTYIEPFKRANRQGAYRYYYIIARLLRGAHKIFGKALSQRGIILAITWALLYSSLIFFISWLVFGIQTIGNTNITAIEIDPVFRIPVGLFFILSIIFVAFFFKSKINLKIREKVSKTTLSTYLRTASFFKRNVFVYFPATIKKYAVVLIDDWALSYRCNLVIAHETDSEPAVSIIEQFREKALKYNIDNAILIVTRDNSAYITGLNSKLNFEQVAINDPKSEILTLLRSKPFNRSRIIELATSIIGQELTSETVLGGFFASATSSIVFIFYGCIFFIGSWFFSTAVAISFYLAVSIFLMAYLYENEDNEISQYLIRGIVAGFMLSFFLASRGDYSVLLFVFVFPLTEVS